MTPDQAKKVAEEVHTLAKSLLVFHNGGAIAGTFLGEGVELFLRMGVTRNEIVNIVDQIIEEITKSERRGI